jgi:hypothetical protein
MIVEKKIFQKLYNYPIYSSIIYPSNFSKYNMKYPQVWNLFPGIPEWLYKYVKTKVTTIWSLMSCNDKTLLL